MKIITTIGFLVFFSSFLFGQTNIFPASGNVGIGTTSPQAKVDILVNANAGLAISGNTASYVGADLLLTRSNTSTGVGQGVTLQMGDPGSNSHNIIQSSLAGLQFFNCCNNSGWIERMRISNNGNVAINTSLDVGGARNANSAVGGLNVFDYSQGTATNIQLAQSAWGASHAILFNAYKSNPQVNGNLRDLGNVKYSNDAGANGSGAGMIHFLANSGRMDFYVTPNSAGQNTVIDWQVPVLSLQRGGNIGIGTTSPDAKLTVNGQVHATEVKITLSVPAPDYVFEPTYILPTLEAVKTYIDENKHLPEIPSAKEMETNGVKLGDMNMLLLKKIEELTLYVIELKKENEGTKARMKEMQIEISQIKK